MSVQGEISIIAPMTQWHTNRKVNLGVATSYDMILGLIYSSFKPAPVGKRVMVLIWEHFVF